MLESGSDPINCNLYLTGFMGVGKSTVGPLLAARLGRDYLDLDHLISDRAGLSLASLFKEKDENYFRQLETSLLKEVSTRTQHVIALGGGSLLQEVNRKILSESGLCIYLRADMDTLAERIIQAPLATRPLLEMTSDESLAVRVRVLMRTRKRFYEDAHLAIDTDGRSPHQTVADILALLKGGKCG